MSKPDADAGRRGPTADARGAQPGENRPEPRCRSDDAAQRPAARYPGAPFIDPGLGAHAAIGSAHGEACPA